MRIVEPEGKHDHGNWTMINHTGVWMLALVLLLITFESAGAEEISPLDRFSKQEREKLLADEVLYEYVNYEGREKQGKGLGHGQVHVIVKMPIDVCWSIMTDFEKKQEYFPRVVLSEIVKKEENRTWVRETLDFWISKIGYVMVQKIDTKNYRGDFYLDHSYPHDIKDTYGFWYWEKIDDKTSLLTYAVINVDVGIPLPKFIFKALFSKDLPGIAENLKKRIESNGTWQINQKRIRQ